MWTKQTKYLYIKLSCCQGEWKNCIWIYTAIIRCKVILLCLRIAWSSPKRQGLVIKPWSCSFILPHVLTHTCRQSAVHRAVHRKLDQPFSFQEMTSHRSISWTHAWLPKLTENGRTPYATVQHQWKQWFIIHCHLSNLWSIETTVNGPSVMTAAAFGTKYCAHNLLWVNYERQRFPQVKDSWRNGNAMNGVGRA